MPMDHWWTGYHITRLDEKRQFPSGSGIDRPLGEGVREPASSSTCPYTLPELAIDQVLGQVVGSRNRGQGNLAS